VPVNMCIDQASTSQCAFTALPSRNARQRSRSCALALVGSWKQDEHVHVQVPATRICLRTSTFRAQRLSLAAEFALCYILVHQSQNSFDGSMMPCFSFRPWPQQLTTCTFAPCSSSMRAIWTRPQAAHICSQSPQPVSTRLQTARLAVTHMAVWNICSPVQAVDARKACDWCLQRNCQVARSWHAPWHSLCWGKFHAHGHACTVIQ
jgi:hypothetical protein